MLLHAASPPETTAALSYSCYSHLSLTIEGNAVESFATAVAPLTVKKRTTQMDGRHGLMKSPQAKPQKIRMQMVFSLDRLAWPGSPSQLQNCIGCF